jgi:hypothetical protein
VTTPSDPAPDGTAPANESAGDRLREHWRGELERWSAVSAHRPLPGHGPLGTALAISRRAARYLLRWYINPIVEQQNAGNAAFTVALSHLIALDSARRAEVARIRAGRGQGTGNRGQGTR